MQDPTYSHTPEGTRPAEARDLWEAYTSEIDYGLQVISYMLSTEVC